MQSQWVDALRREMLEQILQENPEMDQQAEARVRTLYSPPAQARAPASPQDRQQEPRASDSEQA